MGFCLTVNPDHQQPLYLQLCEQLKGDIIGGLLPAHSKLPSIRNLSMELTLSKSTIENAYQQLEMEGYIYAKPKVGYFVCALENGSWFATAEQPLISALPAKTVDIKYNFRNDYIDQDSFDFNLWRKYINQSLQDDAPRFADYGDPMGAYELRLQLSSYLQQSRRVQCTPEQIVIGAGTQVLLNMLCGLIKPRYHRIGFEEPGFRHGRYVFEDQQFEVIPIPLEADGLSINYLKDQQVDMVYVSPSNQFPTGAVMPVQKRLALINWIKSQDGLIIEDDYDSELRYFGHPIPSLQGLDTSSSVVYIGSFSKILLPAIRVSYMVLPPKLLAVLHEKIDFYNQTASLVEQLTLARFMADGHLYRQIRKTRKIYAKKNQLLLEQVQKQMGDKVKILGSETGLHVLLEVNSPKSADTLVKEAKQVGIAMTPLHTYTSNPLSHGMLPVVIMGYGGIQPEQIQPAIELLQNIWFTDQLKNTV